MRSQAERRANEAWSRPIGLDRGRGGDEVTGWAEGRRGTARLLPLTTWTHDEMTTRQPGASARCEWIFDSLWGRLLLTFINKFLCQCLHQFRGQGPLLGCRPIAHRVQRTSAWWHLVLLRNCLSGLCTKGPRWFHQWNHSSDQTRWGHQLAHNGLPIFLPKLSHELKTWRLPS